MEIPNKYLINPGIKKQKITSLVDLVKKNLHLRGIVRNMKVEEA